MKRKIVITLLAFAFILLGNLIITNNKAFAYTAKDSNGLTWYYSLSNGEAKNVYLSSGSYGTTLTIPSSLGGYPVTSISYNYNGILGNNQTNRSKITSVVIPDSVKTIGTYAFAYFYGLTSIDIPDSVEEIGNYAFYYCSNITEITFPSSVKKIGNGAFRYTGLTGTLSLPSNITSIGDYAFENCKGLTGDLTIPDTVTYLGYDAFENCTGLNGVLTVGNGVKSILNYTFSGTKFSRVNLGEVTSLGYKSFTNYTDIWVDNEEANVTLNSTGVSGDGTNPVIHWRNDTHEVEITSLPGVKLVNSATGEEILSGDYACETEFSFKLQIDSGYSYQNLQVIIVDNNDTKNFETYEGNTTTTYEFKTLLRDRKIYIQNLSSQADLALRMFITEVNRNLVSKSRVPTVKMVDGEFKYLHTKNPVSVKTGDLVTYKIRVYNESLVATSANKIAVHIPDGFEYAQDNRTNTNYGWTYLNGEAVTSYLAGEEVPANLGNGVAKYKELEIVLKVTAVKNDDSDTLKTVYAEIKEAGSDIDSTPGNISITTYDNYRTEELYASDSNSYLRCGEDDEDFDTVFLRGKVKIDYNIIIDKIDSESKELLTGAKFALYDEDGNEIAVVESDANGRIDFGGLTTYGNGTDIYYIQEVMAPEGYYLTDNKKYKIRVEKTILDDDKGLYSLKVVCDTVDWTIDTTRYEFTPVYTAEQLRKIGSGEIVEIDGVKFEYNVDTNYKLMNDIDISSEAWTPIDHEMTCIIDGDGHKISGLTITGGYMDSSEIGMFSVFSGIIQNLELENVTIAIGGYQKDAENISGKTGVGAFAGVMRDGYIINCKVSGLISTSVTNVGGFVGHTLENGIVRIDSCINNANIVGRLSDSANNYGGIVGCALGSISVNNSINNGKIEAAFMNVGGLVGYVKPSKYQDLSVNIGYDEDNKILNLLVENSTTSADYEVLLREIDIDTEEALLGGIFSVYDGGKNIIDGLERLELDEIMKKILDRELRAVGLDTYYIIEDEPVKGYTPLTGVVKLDIERYWDDEAGCYKIRISSSVLTEDQYEKAESNLRSTFDRGDIFTDVKIEKANINSEKAEFIGCTNNGEIASAYMNGAGIVGTVHGYTYIKDCKNTAHIQVPRYGKAGGIISELYAFKKSVEIEDCENSGKIESMNSTGASAGIAAHVVADLNISGCKNTGEVFSAGPSAAAGILAEAIGVLHIDSCDNSGYIRAVANYSNSSDVDVVVAGILAKNISIFNCIWVETTSRNDNVVYITNCTNTGNLDSNNHMAGMIAYSDASYVEITDCIAKDCYIHDNYAADKGGMAGYMDVPNMTISNCTIDNIDMIRTADVTNNTYGCTGGVIGNWCTHGWLGANLENLSISNCTVTNSTVQSNGQNTGGIIGMVISSGSRGNIQIEDCYVGDCTVLNKDAFSTYGGAAGIMANTYGMSSILIENCVVERTPIEVRSQNVETTGGDFDAGGIFGMGQNINSIVVNGCDVKDSTVTCLSRRTVTSYSWGNSYSGDGTATAGGIIAEVGTDIDQCVIDDCNVLNTNVSTNSGTLAGIIAHAGIGGYYYDNDYRGIVTNCTFDGGTLTNTAVTTSASITSGIVGYASNRIYLENNLVDNAHIYSYMSNEEAGTNTTGILGMANGKTSLVNCDVKNTEILGTGGYGRSGTSGYLANISGVLGYAYGDVEITDCDVGNTTFTGYRAGNVAGILGALGSSKATIDNCTVTRSTMENDTYTTQSPYDSSAAGMVGEIGYGSITNSKVEDCIIKTRGSVAGGIIAVTVEGSNKDFVLDNITVKGVGIEDTGYNVRPTSTSSEYHSRSVGGVIGSSNTSLYISNATVDNLNISSQATTNAGVVGYTADMGKFENVSVNKLTLTNDPITNGYVGSVAGVIGDIAKASAPISNVSITNSDISSKCHHVSGFIGTSNSDITIEDLTIDSIEVTNKNETSTGYTGNASGVMAFTDSKLTVNNAVINNEKVKVNTGASTNAYHVGGILAQGYSADFDNVTLTNSEITNSLGGLAGGFVGMDFENFNSEYPITVTNSNINNVTLTGNSHGGVIAGLSNKVTVSDTNLEKVTVNTPDVSGILVGIPHTRTENTITVENTNIKDSSVTSYNQAGGVVGYMNSAIDVNGLTLDNVVIDSSSNNAGGIAGNNDSTIKAYNVSLKNGTKVSGAGHTGGLIGYTREADIDNVVVDNATITSLGAYSSGMLAGVQGNISANKVKVINNTVISGPNHSGGIVGNAMGNVVIKEPVVTDITITSLGESAGGVAGIITGSMEVPSATVKNATITANNHSTGIAGSVSNTATTSNSSVSNVTLTSKGQSLSCLTSGYFGAVGTLTISASSLTDATINGYYHMAGVLSTGTIDAKNITLDNINITMNARNTSVGVGGLVGILNGGSSIDGVNANKVTLKANGALTGGLVGIAHANLNDVHIKNSDIIQDTFANVGGIAGILDSGNLTNSSVDNCNVSGATGGSYGDVGGAVGSTSFSTDTIDNVKVSNTTVKSDKIAGGIVGLANGAVKNCTVNTVTVESDYDISKYGTSLGGLAGGITGIATGVLENNKVIGSTVKSTRDAGGIEASARGEITGCTVSGTTVSSSYVTSSYGESNGGNVGGIVGTTNYLLNNNKVTGSTITSNKLSGGIAGTTMGTVSNCTVENTGVTSSIHAGGIVATNHGIITGATVSSVTVTAKNTAGGIVGALDGRLLSSTVDDATVTVEAVKDSGDNWIGGDAGGAVGATGASNIDTVSVTNSSITSNKLAGGILGAGIDTTDPITGNVIRTTLANLTVSNNTVTYGEEELTTGEYIGAPDIYDSSVSGLMLIEEEEEQLEPEEDEVADEPEKVQTVDAPKAEETQEESEEVQDTTSEPENTEEAEESEDEENSESDTTEATDTEDIEKQEETEAVDNSEETETIETPEPETTEEVISEPAVEVSAEVQEINTEESEDIDE